MRMTVRIVLLVGLWAQMAAVLQAERKFVTGDFTQRIPAGGQGLAWMEPVTLEVPEHWIISDLDVYLDITHSEVSDLLIYLDSPAGDTIELKDDQLWQSKWPDISFPDMHGTIFDDEAAISLIEGTPPFTGCFLPAAGNSLSIFDGQDAYGNWTLRIYDLALADSGTLDRWELQIEHTPEPTGMLYLLLALARLCTKRRRHKKTSC